MVPGLERNTVNKRIVILTGNRGAGKSTVCVKVRELLHKRGIPVRGIISTGLFNTLGVKTGFEAEDADTRERWSLGVKGDADTGPRYGPFAFSGKGLDRAVKVLCAGLKSGEGVVMVDEIGPLEMETHEGFYPALKLLPVTTASLLLVVRPALVLAVEKIFPGEKTVLYEVGRESRNRLPVRIADLMGREG